MALWRRSPFSLRWDAGRNRSSFSMIHCRSDPSPASNLWMSCDGYARSFGIASVQGELGNKGFTLTGYSGEREAEIKELDVGYSLKEYNYPSDRKHKYDSLHSLTLKKME